MFVVNCNLQRLDGPVRGNGSIVQELEAAFRGAGWNVIKCLWGAGGTPCSPATHPACCSNACMSASTVNSKPSGLTTEPLFASEFFGKYPELLKLVEHMTDDELWALRRGGHDPVKVYNAYKRAMETTGQPTVILAKTVKGYGLGETAEGRMTAHQQKKLGAADLMKVRDSIQHFNSGRNGSAYRVLPSGPVLPGDAVSEVAHRSPGRPLAVP